MTTTNAPTSRFIEPLDVLFLRGNQLFGEPGSYGEALMPPWPSVAAGALRTRLLTDSGMDLAAFAAGQAEHPQLGTPTQPGPFVLQAFQVARKREDGSVELLMPLPADLVVTNKEGARAPEVGTVQPLRPATLHPALASSSPLPLLPVLAQGNDRSKPASGWWLTGNGWRSYLHGQPVTATDLVHTSQLWGFDERVGVGLDENTRSAANGKLFTTRAIALKEGVGFAVAASGNELPEHGTLRLGGDGRAATVHAAPIAWPAPDYAAIVQARRCRIVLTSPGIFAGGWRLPGMADDHTLGLRGLRARVVAAAVSRADTISGWNLVTRQPKPAQKTAAAGSVYWLEDLDATPEALGKLVAHGLWAQPGEDAQRRAEGFNRFSFASF
ncbi:MAG: type III-B CRISPR module-associated protein Cmr3 [Rhodoferax sp.]|nr:type III-B CRISPR module-associated protein Cmr3 [Rhodoferax sp.]